MSLQNYQKSVTNLQKEINSLNEKINNENKKKLDKEKKKNQITKSIGNNISFSQLNSKNSQIIKYNENISQIEKTILNLQKQVTSKLSKLHQAEQNLAKEESKELNKRKKEEKKLRREREEYERNLQREFSSYSDFMPISSSFDTNINVDIKSYDFFINHASEDKDDFVEPLAKKLEELGRKVWYDDFVLTVGDSLRSSIDRGLANSKYGIVILSSYFFAKNWTQYELNGLVAREVEGDKVILPIWHKVTKNEVLEHSPSLADKIALNSSLKSVDEIASELATLIKR